MADRQSGTGDEWLGLKCCWADELMDGRCETNQASLQVIRYPCRRERGAPRPQQTQQNTERQRGGRQDRRRNTAKGWSYGTNHNSGKATILVRTDMHATGLDILVRTFWTILSARFSISANVDCLYETVLESLFQWHLATVHSFLQFYSSQNLQIFDSINLICWYMLWKKKILKYSCIATSN